MATTIVIGSDSGVGFEIAKSFGKHGQNIILVSRDQAKLDQATNELQAKNISATNYMCDANNFDEIRSMMKKLTEDHDDISNLVFNVGNKHLDNAMSSDVGLIDNIFQTNVLSAVVSARAFIENTKPDQARSIIFTGGGAAVRPSNKASTLSLTKAALRSYAYTLHDELASKNVFVGLVTIQGIIDSSDQMAADKVAQSYWQLLENRDEVEAFYPEKVSKSEFE